MAPKDLHTLIRIRKWDVDEKQRAVGALQHEAPDRELCRHAELVEEQHVERQADLVAPDLHVALLEHVEQAPRVAVGIGQQAQPRVGLERRYRADRLGALGETAMQVMNLEISRQAAMIAYLDDFKLMMILLVVISPLIFFLKPGTAAPGQQPVMAD